MKGSHRSTKRKRKVRGRTIPIKKMSKELLKLGKIVYWQAHRRPSSWAECKEIGSRCPFVGCKYHLYLDVNESTGSIKLNFPDVEVWEMSETCTLNVAKRSGLTLEEVGALMNLTRERVRQVEEEAFVHLVDAIKSDDKKESMEIL